MDMDDVKILNMNTTLLLLRNTLTPFTLLKFAHTSTSTPNFEELYCLISCQTSLSQPCRIIVLLIIGL